MYYEKEKGKVGQNASVEEELAQKKGRKEKIILRMLEKATGSIILQAYLK